MNNKFFIVFLSVEMVIFGLVCAGTGYSIGIFYPDLLDFSGQNDEIPYTNENFTHCANLSLDDTAYCIRNTMASFFNYTVRAESLYEGDEGSIEDVIENGGDCHDYTNIYEATFKKLNYSTYRIRLSGNQSGHALLIAYDYNMKGYCVVDQMFVKCLDMAV